MKVGTYREDGSIADVEILEDTSDAEWLRYKLKVLHVHRESPLCPMQVGDVFDVSLKKGVCFGGMWNLSDEPYRKARGV